MNRILATVSALALAVGLVGCGGGGGEDRGNVGANASVSIDSNSISYSGAPTDVNPVRSLTIAVNNVPPDGVFVAIGFSENGLQAVELIPEGPATAQARVTFKQGASLQDGTYSDAVQILICHDDQCKTQLAGSPLNITTTYTVAATNTVSIDQTELALTALNSSSVPAQASLMLTTAGSAFANELHVVGNSTSIAVTSINATPVSPSQTRVSFNFGQPNQRAVGTYNDANTLRVCYDSACTREVAGSPFEVRTAYTVSNDPQPEPGVAPLVVATRNALPHDVVDAEYSRSLDALVTVSAWPQNALYVYDMATGAETQVLLSKAPKAVSLSPDGTQAAVGHDTLVSHVDLSSVGLAAPRLLDVSADVGDLVLDGRGKVFVFPARDQWVDVHTIDVASNTETLQPGPRANSRARLHPAGNNIYAANNGLYPDDIENYDIASGQATRLGDSPYHGDYPMCGNLWFSEDGAHIFTACGKAFGTSTTPSQDMLYTGSLTLSASSYFGFRILSLSHFAATKEVALIEQSWYECLPYTNMQASCASHLSLYDSDSFSRTAVYSIPPVAVSNLNYAQSGLFVFHRRGGGKLLISRLVGAPSASAEYYLSTLP